MGQVKAYDLMQNPKIGLHNSKELGNLFVPLFFFFWAPTNCYDDKTVNKTEKALPSSGSQATNMQKSKGKASQALTLWWESS